jgi:DNA-binding CsgD family transcriptional regulator
MAPRLTSRAARVAALAVPDDGSATQLAIVASGTAGATGVVDAVVDRARDRLGGVVRVSGRRLERGDPFGAVRDLAPDLSSESPVPDWRDAVLSRLSDGGVALVVDEAQWLDEQSRRLVVGVAERAVQHGVTVVVAHRPAAGDSDLAALDAVLARAQLPVTLGPLDDDEVGELCAIVTGAAVDGVLVDAVAEHTLGLADLVEVLLAAWAAGGILEAGRLAGSPPTEPPAALVGALRSRIDELAPAARTVLDALSAGADLDDGLLSATTDIGPDDLGDAVDELASAGLVVRDTGDVPPLVAAVATAVTPVADRRRFHARLAAALAERGAPATRTGEHLAAAGAQGADAAAAFAAAGDATLADAPELALDWYQRAVAAGLPPDDVAARRAEAAARTGDAPTALRLADAVVSGPAGPERPRALAVLGALLAGRGLWRRSAAVYGELSSARPDTTSADATAVGVAARAPDAAAWHVLATWGIVVTGGAVPGDDSADATATGAGGGSATVTGLASEALRLVRDSLMATAAPDSAAALPLALEASELIESAHSSLVLPTSPHAVGVAIALALSEQSTADHLVTRAREHDVGGAALAEHHRLVQAMVALRSGRWATAQQVLDECAEITLAPREQLTAVAVEAGLARRAGDLARLGQAWSLADGVLLRHPADVLSLEAIGELAIAASRLGQWDRMAPKARELGDVVRGLGEPPLWALPLRWIGLQVALATDDHEAVARRAAEVEAIKPAHPRLAALADAARAWVAILGGTADPDAVGAVADSLAGLGLVWEASRLTGQAAVRAGDPMVTRALLERARDLKAALPAAEVAAEAPATPSVLSEREQTVAQHVVDGLTHKEIGAQLYISPKTVEHHVAKIRQKLGASTRAEMLAAVRTHLAS